MNKPTRDDYLPHRFNGSDTQEDVQKNFWRDALLRIPKPEPHDEDYLGEDGLIYCGRCHTPRQFVMQKQNILHGMVLPIACACRKAAMDAREAERQAQYVRELRQRCFSSATMHNWNFAHDDGSCNLINVAQRYVSKWGEMRQKNFGLMLYGEVGTGKSFLAACIANALIDRSVAVRMVSFPQVVAEMQADFNRQAAYIADLVDYPLLILDDFGVERTTAYVQELLFSLVDARVRSGKPLIITTNLTPERLKNPTSEMDARVYDRILQLCFPIKIEGESRRTANSDSRRVEFADLMAE